MRFPDFWKNFEILRKKWDFLKNCGHNFFFNLDRKNTFWRDFSQKLFRALLHDQNFIFWFFRCKKKNFPHKFLLIFFINLKIQSSDVKKKTFLKKSIKKPENLKFGTKQTESQKQRKSYLNGFSKKRDIVKNRGCINPWERSAFFTLTTRHFSITPYTPKTLNWSRSTYVDDLTDPHI